MTTGENRFVVVCPMFNASGTLPTLLHSLCGQSYPNWRLILIDDVSNEDEYELERQTVTQFQCMLGGRYSKQIEVHSNNVKQWEVANVLKGISMCEPDDIICRIDADDWVTELDGLMILNAAYNQFECDCLWTMHRWGFSDKNISGPMVPLADPYKHPWVSSHLKTFRKHLLNGVPYENFTNMNGDLVQRAGDQSLYLPVLYNAKKRVFLPRVFYHYSINEQGGKVYQTDDAKFQKAEADFLRRRGYVPQGKTWEEGLQTPPHKVPT